MSETGSASGTGKIGRNDPCPCGSGRKHKQCHYGKTEEAIAHESAEGRSVIGLGAALAVVGGAIVGFTTDASTGVGLGAAILIGFAAWTIFRNPPPPRSGGGDPAAINFGNN